MLQAGSPKYKVAGMFRIAQRTLSHLMAIYKEKNFVRSGHLVWKKIYKQQNSSVVILFKEHKVRKRIIY